MRLNSIGALFFFALSFLFVAGCSHDPQVLKKRAVSKGDAYFAKGKYREATIEYANALKIDSHFEQAYFKLGESLLKQGLFNYAYISFSGAVELDPGDTQAQLE